MKYFFSLAALAAAIASPGAGAAENAEPALAPNPQIEIAYNKPANPAFVPIYERLKSRHVLETLQLFLAPLKLPGGAKLIVQFDQCGGAASVPYEHGGPVTICYKYVQTVEQAAPKSDEVLAQGVVTPGAAVVGPVVQAVLHQTALALFDVLNLPIWGRPSDAADRLSAFIMVQFGPAVAWNTIVGAGWFLAATASSSAPDFTDVRGFVAQRFYTTICIAYGAQERGAIAKSSGVDFARWIEKPWNRAAGNLPESRARSCPIEYDRIKRAFIGLFLQPKLVDTGLLEEVQKKLVCKGGTPGEPLFQFACAQTGNE